MQCWLRTGVLALLLPLGACATIDNYTDPALKTGKTGFLYYPPKPYVLVGRTGAKDKPNDIQVIYLPDLSQPRYAVMRGGFGSSKMGLTFSNGVLVSANQESDPKITEAITALAGIPGALASAAKTSAEAAQIREEAGDLPAAGRIAREVAADLTSIAADPAARTVLNPSQIEVLRRLPQQLQNAATALERPGAGPTEAATALQAIQGVRDALAQIKPVGDPSDSSRAFWNRIRSAESALDRALAELKPKETQPPTLTLYEVVIGDDGTTLREVPISTLTGVGSRPTP